MRCCLFVEFLQKYRLLAANTWKGDVRNMPSDVDFFLEQAFTHRMYSTGVLRQIDFACCSIGLSMCCRVLNGFRDEALTDHWPHLLLWSMPANVLAKPTRQATCCNRKGWQPKTKKDKHEFNECFRASFGEGRPDDLRLRSNALLMRHKLQRRLPEGPNLQLFPSSLLSCGADSVHCRIALSASSL